MKFWRHFLLLGLALCCLFGGRAQTAAEDVLLKTLKQQADSLIQVYKKAAVPAYFLSYRVDKEEQFRMSARSGSLTNNQCSQQSVLTIQVRVGSEQADNFYPIGNANGSCQTRTVKLPLDDNELIVGQILNLETEKAYKEACRQYSQVLSALSDRQSVHEKSGEFIKPLPYAYYELPVESIFYNEAEVIHLLESATGAMSHNAVFQCSAAFQCDNNRKYFVSSEGAAIVQNYTHTSLQLDLSGLSENGVPLSLPKRYDVEFPNELPSAENLIRDVQKMEALVSEAEEVERTNAGVCPVVFSNEAAGIFWQHSLVPIIAGNLVLNAEPVLPTDISIVSDPTSSLSDDWRLLGSYRYDDEGCEGQKKKLVDNGLLVEALYSSSCNWDYLLSNGHGRAVAGQQPTRVPANLLITTSHPYSNEELSNALIEEAARQGKSYGYLVEAASLSDDGQSIVPLIMWKIFTDKKKPDELVCGVEFVGTPWTTLSHVSKLGTTRYYTACSRNGVPYHCCSPAVLVAQMESRETEIPLRAVSLTQVTPKDESPEGEKNFSDVLFRAMDDEIEANIQIDPQDVQKPYYISYLVTDAEKCHIESTRGSLISTDSRPEPLRAVQTRVLVGDNNFNSDYVEYETGWNDWTAAFPLDNNYNNIRRQLSQNTDYALKNALRAYADKLRLGKPQNLPDRGPIWLTNMQMDNPYSKLNHYLFENIANELSFKFEEYGFLTRSGAVIDAYRGDAYFRASDGAQYRQPISLLRIRIYAQTKADDGAELKDYTDFYFQDVLELEDREPMIAAVREMAERLRDLRNAPVVTEIYDGPVLFADEAAAQVFANAFVESNPNLVAQRQMLQMAQNGQQLTADDKASLYDQIDHVIVNRSLDIHAVDGLSAFEGKSLIGHYYIDADGMKVEGDWDLVRRGELVTLLTNRSPMEMKHQSNGHQRLTLREGKVEAEPGVGVLKLTCHNQYREEQLIKLLRKKARAAGCQNAYIVWKMMDENDCFIPVYVTRVNVATGKQIAVRMNAIRNFKVDDFREMCASSPTKIAVNLMTNRSKAVETNALEGIPSSVIVPDMLLFERVKQLNTRR